MQTLFSTLFKKCGFGVDAPSPRVWKKSTLIFVLKASLKHIFQKVPVNYVWIEDHNISVNAEDDNDDDHGHLEDLEEGMDDVGVKTIVKIVQILTFVVKQDHIDNYHK